MELFEREIDPHKNWLPKDGTVNYYGKIFEESISDEYFDFLMNSIPWKNDEAIILGKLVRTKRKVAWFGEKEYEYSYSGTTKVGHLFTKELLELKKICEAKTGENFNSVLLNLYHDGSEGMAYHSDGETDLKKNGAIASLTFGAERKFSFKHKASKERIDLFLEHGSLLVMKDETQSHWLHRLPPTTKINKPRINLTFRTIVEI